MLRRYISEHLSRGTFLSVCPYPLCDITSDSSLSMMDHFVEYHGLRNARVNLDNVQCSFQRLLEHEQACYSNIEGQPRKRQRKPQEDQLPAFDTLLRPPLA